MVTRDPGRRAWCWIAGAFAFSCIAADVAAQAKRPRRQKSVAPALVIEGPQVLVLGREANAEVRVRVPEGVPFRLHTNTGVLGEPVQMRPGEYRATYEPPDQRFPQVALIAAISDDGVLFAQHRLELHGTAAVQVDSEPRVQVSVRIAGRVYGPVTANDRGRATVDITVPPGYPEVTSIATDSLGNTKEAPLPLGVPPIGRVLAVCPEAAQTIVVLALDDRGRLDANAALDLTASRAVIGKTRKLAPGVYRVELGVPEDVRAGETARVAVALRGAPNARSECSLKIPLELPNAITLALSTTRLSAAEIAPVTVRISLGYPGKRERASVPVLLEVELGKLAATRLRTSSEAETTWEIPASFLGHTRVRITARAADASAHAEVALEPGPIARIRATLEDDTLLADGSSTTELTVHVLDAYDNPVGGSQLMAAAAGRIGAFRELGPGHYRASYRVPFERTADVDRITVREQVSGATGDATISLRGVRPPFALGVRGGYSSNFARVAGPLVGVLAAYRLPFAKQALTFGFDVAYHYGSDAQRTVDNREQLDVRVDAVPVLARAAYGLTLGDIDLALLAGAGVVLAQTELASATTDTVRAKTTSFAWNAAVRGMWSLGPGAALLELGYLHSDVASEAISGNLGGAQLTAGYAVDLGR